MKLHNNVIDQMLSADIHLFDTTALFFEVQYSNGLLVLFSCN